MTADSIKSLCNQDILSIRQLKTFTIISKKGIKRLGRIRLIFIIHPHNLSWQIEETILLNYHHLPKRFSRHQITRHILKLRIIKVIRSEKICIRQPTRRIACILRQCRIKGSLRTWIMRHINLTVLEGNQNFPLIASRIRPRDLIVRMVKSIKTILTSLTGNQSMSKIWFQIWM